MRQLVKRALPDLLAALRDMRDRTPSPTPAPSRPTNPPALPESEPLLYRKSGMRFRIFQRDGFRCIYCGFTPVEDEGENALDLEHVVPLIEGGAKRDIFNLATSCVRCNASKSGNRMHAEQEDLILDEIARRNEEMLRLERAEKNARRAASVDDSPGTASLCRSSHPPNRFQ